MSILQRVDTITKVWAILIPHLPGPNAETISRWLNYSDPAIEQAIVRTARKFSPAKVNLATFDPVQAYRYTTGTAKLINEQQKTAGVM